MLLCGMIKTTTVKIDDRLHKAAKSLTEKKLIRGGFSAYIEKLVIADLKKNDLLPNLEDK
jgi:hypothetical protein